MSRRIDQVNALLGAELGRLMANVKAGRSIATITGIETSPDLSHATVWVSVLPDEDAAWEIVQEQLPELQSGLAERIELKKTPKLELKRDRSGETVSRIDRLLKGRL